MAHTLHPPTAFEKNRAPFPATPPLSLLTAIPLPCEAHGDAEHALIAIAARLFMSPANIRMPSVAARPAAPVVRKETA